jgi:tRNA-specific 2-thiouridylase
VGERRYVVDIRADTATVTVGDKAALLRERVSLRDLRFSRALPPRFLAQSRAHGAAVPALLDGDDIVFDTPQTRVAPGQVVAFYDGELCCGGGIVAA